MENTMNKLTILTTVAAIAFSSGAFAQAINANAQNVNVSGVNNKVTLDQIGTRTSRAIINVGDKNSQMGKDNNLSVTQKNGDYNRTELNLTGGDNNNITTNQDGSRNTIKATLGKDNNSFGVNQIGNDNLVDIDGQATANNGRFNGQINQTGDANKFKFKTYAVDKDTKLNADQIGNNNDIDITNRHGEVSGYYLQKGTENSIKVENAGTSRFDATQVGSGNKIDVLSRNGADNKMDMKQEGNDNLVDVTTRHGEVKGNYTQKGNKNKIVLDQDSGTSRFDATQVGNGNDIRVESRYKADTFGNINQTGNENKVVVKNFNSEKGVNLDVKQRGNSNEALIVDNTRAGGNDFNNANITQEGNSKASVSFIDKHGRGGNNTANVFQAANSIPVNVNIAGRSNTVSVTQK